VSSYTQSWVTGADLFHGNDNSNFEKAESIVVFRKGISNRKTGKILDREFPPVDKSPVELRQLLRRAHANFIFS
jgi:hypothetical protein